MTGQDPLPLVYLCPRCTTVFGTHQGRDIHLTLVHKEGTS